MFLPMPFKPAASCAHSSVLVNGMSSEEKGELTAAVLRIGGLHRLGQAARNTESRHKLSRLTW